MSKLKNMFLDWIFPPIFWGTIYLSAVIIGYWTYNQYLSWLGLMMLYSPLNVVSGRVVNTYRKYAGYQYKGYD
jgi:hypothetical protein